MKKLIPYLLPITLYLLPTAVGCTIEPPLHLPQEAVELSLPMVVTDLQVVWNMNIDWKEQWWYDWDEEDIERWGPLEYPEPTYYEVRRFYQGEFPSDNHHIEEAFTLYENSFRRQYNYGYYDLLVWSNIDSKDGTQVLTIDEKDIDNIIASTTKTLAAAGYARINTRVVPIKNQPEVFYSGYERSFNIPRDGFGKDWYFDEKENVWVKNLTMTLDPLVYIYLVQVVIYNNNGKIKNLSDNALLTGMAESVNINTGWTSDNDVDVVFDMRMKHDRMTPHGRTADIIGGKFTTFGLCDLAPWRESRSEQNYSGSRSDLANLLRLDLSFSNDADQVFSYDITDQVQRQIHGGLITIEIDADTITIPTNPGGSSSGFDPVVEQPDSITHEFEM